MNGPVRQRWLARLRSGQDAQARRFLHPRPGVFDVLGILVDLYVQDGHGQWEIKKPGRKVFTFKGVESVLPPEVRRWAGLETGDVQWLIDINDRGCTLSQIADAIEQFIPEENHDDDEPTAHIGPPVGQSAPHRSARPEPME